MGDTKIQWADKTWNPTTGCTKVSAGCKFCYAERVADSLWARQYPPNADGTVRTFTDIRLHPDRLAQPASWKKPQRVFVDSMSDLFHPDIPDSFIDRVFAMMALVPQHTYQILTKRPERALAYLTFNVRLGYIEAAADQELQRLAGVGTFLPHTWPLPNVWIGTSVEDQKSADLRIPMLQQIPAALRFLSCEPLLGPLDLSPWLTYQKQCFRPWCGVQGRLCIDCSHASTEFTPDVEWVIVGGESGAGARPFQLSWAYGILAQCAAAGVPCFVKQLGRHPATHEGPIHLKDDHGGDISEWPESLRVRRFPPVETGAG